MGTTLIIKFGAGNLIDGFLNIALRVEQNGKPILNSIGALPSATTLSDLLDSWHKQFADMHKINRSDGFEFEDDCVTNISIHEFQDLCEKLKTTLNQWLNSPLFQDAEMAIRTKLKRDDAIRIILETDDFKLWCLPWHLWDLFQDYPNAEIASQ